MNTALTLFITSAVGSLVLAAFLEQFLRKYFPHRHRPWGPKHHLEKAPVPTAGGIVLIVLTLLGALAFASFGGLRSYALHALGIPAILLTFVPLAYGTIGLVDDFLKSRTNTSGFKARYKIALQLITAVIFLNFSYEVGSKVLLPFSETNLQLPYWLYLILGSFLILMLVNGSNFSDGLDGLLCGLALIFCFGMLFFLGVMSGQIPLFDIQPSDFSQVAKPSISSFCFYSISGLSGAITGLLVLNFKPAKLYIGDSGSYFIGAFLAVASILSGLMIFLVILGAVFAIEVASVVLQVSYFRITGGKRIFKMSPLHHHVELSGFGELKTVFLFWGLQLIAVGIAVSGFLLGLP